jgi:hypothetical protein
VILTKEKEEGKMKGKKKGTRKGKGKVRKSK